MRNIGLTLLVLGGCASGASPAPNGAASECSVQLPPQGQVRRAASSAAGGSPESRVVVHAEVPLGPLERTLEARVPKQLADGRARIGPGGTVSYHVERGPLSLRVTRSALLIETQARARAEACRGDDCYARCDPEALVVAEVPLLLGPDYRFRKTSVSATFTRGCKVSTLGGLLTVDITPTLRSQLEPELEKVARDIDRQLPELRSRVAEAWAELGVARELPLGGCFVLQPFGIVQGPFTASSTTLKARFAVQAHPELRTSCGVTVDALPLPPLVTDASLPKEGVVRLGMVTPLSSVARALESTPVARAEVTAQGADVDLQLALKGAVCGDVALQATLDFSGEDPHLRLTEPTLLPGEKERLDDSKLDVATLVSAVRIAPLLSVQGFQSAAPALAASASPPGVRVQANVSSARAAGATARGVELVAWLEATGAISLQLETLPER